MAGYAGGPVPQNPGLQKKMMEMQVQQGQMSPQDMQLAYGAIPENVFTDLVARLDQVPSIQKQQQGIGDLEQLRTELLQQEIQPSLAPFAGLIDAFGTSTAPTAKNYHAPQTPEEQNAMLFEINKQLGKEQAGLTEDEANLLKAQLGYVGGLQQTAMKGATQENVAGIQSDAKKYAADRAKEARDKAVASKKTAGETAYEKAYAQRYTDFVVSGGSATSAETIDKVDEEIARLEKDPKLTGDLAGRTPLKDLLNPESYTLSDNLRSVVTGNSKAFLPPGPASDTDIRNAIEAVYNPKIPAKAMLERLRKFSQKLHRIYEAQTRAAEYFQENGTILGFKGKIWEPKDLKFEDSGAAAPKATPKTGGKTEVKRQYNAGLNKTRIFYSDGTSKDVDGKQDK